MTDIFSHKITNKQGGQPNPYKRKNKKQQTSAIYLQTFGQKLVGIMDGIFQEYPGQSGDNTNQKTQDDDKIPFFDMAYPPTQKTHIPVIPPRHNSSTNTNTDSLYQRLFFPNTFQGSELRIKFQHQPFATNHIHRKFLNFSQLRNNSRISHYFFFPFQ